MNLDEYIEDKGFKPLTDKEIERGKANLKVYGTQQDMPWSTIFTRIAAGQPIEELAHSYGHGRKIALFAKLEGVTVEPILEDTIKQAVDHRATMNAIAEQSPEVAATMMEMMNEIAPTFQQKVAVFLDKAVDVATEKLESKFIEASDIDVLVRAVQRATDTTGHTERFSTSNNGASLSVQVTGYDVVLDYQPPNHQEVINAIDAEIADDNS